MRTKDTYTREVVGGGRHLGLLCGVGQGEVCCPSDTDSGNEGLDSLLAEIYRGGQATHNLELDGHDPEVDDLHSWPDQEVGLQRRDINVLELALDGALSTTLGDGHVCEECRKTSGRKQKLVKSDTLQSRYPWTADLRDRECAREETEPAVLNRRHEETVGHEANCTLEVEWRRQLLRVGNDIVVRPRVAAVKLVDLDSEEVVLASAAFTIGALPHGGEGLSHCVCDTTKNLPSNQLLLISAVRDEAARNEG